MPKFTDVTLKLRSTQRVVNDQNRIVMAEGRMALLEAIDETGSINQAAKKMGMAYKSAWSKVRSTEAHLKTQIVVSHTSTGTRLTQAGRELLNKYRRVKEQCVAADDVVFESVFTDNLGESLHSGAWDDRTPPIISFVGHSGSGKTTIIEELIPLLTQMGLKVAIIKHDVHGFEMDKPGKDTWRHKQAGAVATIISSANQIGMVADVHHDHQPEELAPLLGFADIIIAEGYKRGPHPKIEVFRPHATGDPAPLCIKDDQLLAIISDEAANYPVPSFGTGDVASVAEFVRTWMSSLQ